MEISIFVITLYNESFLCGQCSILHCSCMNKNHTTPYIGWKCSFVLVKSCNGLVFFSLWLFDKKRLEMKSCSLQSEYWHKKHYLRTTTHSCPNVLTKDSVSVLQISLILCRFCGQAKPIKSLKMAVEAHYGVTRMHCFRLRVSGGLSFDLQTSGSWISPTITSLTTINSKTVYLARPRKHWLLHLIQHSLIPMSLPGCIRVG